jgi:hydroxymethylpyrimidine pyrophosphatase-like HAD family hydrolase/energy-coupling factor transporter ATP-binding protein EcfA2
MRYHILATDYDGTLATDERVPAEVIEALKSLKASGRKIIMVTGRELADLQRVFPEYSMFDYIVAENGALIFDPATLEERLLGDPPPEAFVQKLKELKVSPISVGRVIVATWEPHQATVLEAIKETGLEYQVIFNKGAVMILPPGINKAKGLHEALKVIGLSKHNTVAIGDAENDNAMLQSAECAVAVNNALPQVKATADWITAKSRGEGVSELIDELLKDDLASLDKNLSRHFMELGKCRDGSVFQISPHGQHMLFAGTSGSGKSTLTAAFVERMIEKQYQFCLVDPEGDYLDMAGVVTIGDSSQPPIIGNVIQLLSQASQSVVVCILAVQLAERPTFFNQLLSEIVKLQHGTGHPHFMIIDEAHHLIPKEVPESFYNFQDGFTNFLAITTKPDLVNHDFLKRINTTITMGDLPGQTMAEFAALTNTEIKVKKDIFIEKGEVLVWQKILNDTVVVTCSIPGHLLQRHKRKYATGDMGYNSFYFRGPESKLNLKANNLHAFIQMGSGVDDETWLYHLKRNDYINWFRKSVKDEPLAEGAEKIISKDLNAGKSRHEIFKLIQERYTSTA